MKFDVKTLVVHLHSGQMESILCGQMLNLSHFGNQVSMVHDAVGSDDDDVDVDLLIWLCFQYVL